MAQEITIHPQLPMADLDRMANAIAKSGLFGVKTPDQALALMLISQAEGRHPALAARDYDIIQGKPTKKAEAMVRDFMAASGKIEWHQLDDTKADATFSHPSGGSFRCVWDMPRAAAAQLASKEMWKKFPRQMLRSRCVSEGVRTVFPMATSGMYVPEEQADIGPAEPMRDVTPPRPVKADPQSAATSAGDPQQGQPPTVSGGTTTDRAPMPFAVIEDDGSESLYSKGSEYLAALEASFDTTISPEGFWDSNSETFQKWQTLLIQKSTRDGATKPDKAAADAFNAVGRRIIDRLAMLAKAPAA